MHFILVLLVTCFVALLVTEPAVADDLDVCLSPSTVETADRNIAACTRAIQDPRTSRINLSHAYTGRCAEWSSKKEYKRAIDDCNQALAIHGNSSYAYNNRGTAYQGLGDIKRAKADYNKAASMGLEIARDNLRKLGK